MLSTTGSHRTPDGRVLHKGISKDLTYVDHWLILCGEAASYLPPLFLHRARLIHPIAGAE